MKTAPMVLAIAAGLLGVGTAVVFGPSHTTHGIVIPILAGLVAFGAIGATSAVVPSFQDRRNLALTSCAAGLAACGFVGLMSIGPPALVAAFLLLLCAVMNGPWAWRRLIGGAAVFLAVSLVVFSILFVAATRIGVRKVGVPQDTQVAGAFQRVDYADAFRIELPRDFAGDIDEVARTVAASMRPSWLKDGSKDREVRPPLQPGSSVGHWPVFQRSNDEVVLGLERSFIDLRLSILLRDETTHMSVTATTVARYNNWIGVVYFVPVRYGHQIVLADTMRKTKASLDARSKAGKDSARSERTSARIERTSARLERVSTR
ncbi:MAG: DUF2867 domain-containing protein [bacterium]|nr:DUF2867 domain-containing protein [bacterium]